MGLPHRPLLLLHLDDRVGIDVVGSRIVELPGGKVGRADAVIVVGL